MGFERRLWYRLGGLVLGCGFSFTVVDRFARCIFCSFLSCLELGILLLELGFIDDVLFDLLYCKAISMAQRYIIEGNIPLRLWVPSGRLAGPIWKPFFCFLTGLADSPSCARFSAMIAASGVSPNSCTRQGTGKESASGILPALALQSIRKQPATTTHNARIAAAETMRPLCAL